MATEQCRDKWPEPYQTEGALTTDTDRPRQWSVAFVAGTVLARKYAILAPGEDLTEYPPTVQMDLAEWESVCGDYGLDVDGQPL